MTVEFWLKSSRGVSGPPALAVLQRTTRSSPLLRVRTWRLRPLWSRLGIDEPDPSRHGSPAKWRLPVSSVMGRIFKRNKETDSRNGSRACL
jgi:hypothetical protein